MEIRIMGWRLKKFKCYAPERGLEAIALRCVLLKREQGGRIGSFFSDDFIAKGDACVHIGTKRLFFGSWFHSRLELHYHIRSLDIGF